MRHTGDTNQPDETERTIIKHCENREMDVVGIDLGKNSFHVHGVDAEGRKVVGKKFSRQMPKDLVNLPRCTVAMETCAGAHYWGRLVQSWEHEDL